MASSASPDVVKAGYWFFGPDLNRQVAEIHSELFTHLYAGFAVVNIHTGGVTFPPQHEKEFQTFPNTVRQRNPTVKTLLSIGGPGSDISQVVRDHARRTNLINVSKRLAITYGYNGIDLCWLYPSAFDHGDDLIGLLEEWRRAVSQDAKSQHAKERTKDDQFLLTAAVFHHPAIPSPDGRFFNYPDISVFLDFINVLAIDFYTPSNSSGETGPVHAWKTRDLIDRHHEPNRCGSRGICNWINNNGCEAQKLVIGLPFHGYEWNLINPNVYEYFAPANPGNYKDYRTIKEIVKKANYQTWYDSDYFATYSHNNKGSWIGYDDENSISDKVKDAIHGEKKLRGYFAWNVGGDDDNWTLSLAAYIAADAVTRP